MCLAPGTKTGPRSAALDGADALPKIAAQIAAAKISRFMVRTETMVTCSPNANFWAFMSPSSGTRWQIKTAGLVTNVRFWHLADKLVAPAVVRYWSNNGQTKASALPSQAANFLSIASGKL